MTRPLNPDPPEDGPLSLADLRDVARLRKDLARSEDENRRLREQLSQALAGWHTEQQRALALEQRLNPPPVPPAAVPEESERLPRPNNGEPEESRATAAEGTEESAAAPETKPGLLAGLLDFLRD